MLRQAILEAIIFTLHARYACAMGSLTYRSSLGSLQGIGSAATNPPLSPRHIPATLSSDRANDTQSVFASNNAQPQSISITQSDLSLALVWSGSAEETILPTTSTTYGSRPNLPVNVTGKFTRFEHPSFSGYQGPSTGTGSLFAQSCNAASQLWSAVYASVTTSVTISVITTYSYTTSYPPGPHQTFTLCDKYPRVHGSPRISSVQDTKTHTTVVNITTVSADPAQSAPACSINAADCEQLWSNYMLDAKFVLDGLPITGALQLSIWGPSNKYSYWQISTSFIGPRTPACPSSDLRTLTSTCNMAAQRNIGDAASENDCVIYSGPVKLFYFPPDERSGSFCYPNETRLINTTSAAGTPTTVEHSGTTFTSGTAYLSFETLYAKDRCGHTIGTPTSNFLYPLPSSEVTTECASGSPGNVSTSTLISAVEQPGGPINYNYLDGPVPASVYKCMPHCNGGLPGWETLCPTIWDDYNPVLAFPTPLSTLQKEWGPANCYFDTFSLFELQEGGNLLFDPPHLLTPASAAAAPTAASVTAAPTLASVAPAPTPIASSTYQGRTGTPSPKAKPNNSHPGKGHHSVPTLHMPGLPSHRPPKGSSVVPGNSIMSIPNGRSTISTANELTIPLAPIVGHSESAGHPTPAPETEGSSLSFSHKTSVTGTPVSMSPRSITIGPAITIVHASVPTNPGSLSPVVASSEATATISTSYVDATLSVATGSSTTLTPENKAFTTSVNGDAVIGSGTNPIGTYSITAKDETMVSFARSGVMLGSTTTQSSGTEYATGTSEMRVATDRLMNTARGEEEKEPLGTETLVPREATTSNRPTLSVETRRLVIGNKQTASSGGVSGRTTGAVKTLAEAVFPADDGTEKTILGSAMISHGELTTTYGVKLSSGTAGSVINGSTVETVTAPDGGGGILSSAVAPSGSAAGSGDNSPASTRLDVLGSGMSRRVRFWEGWHWVLLILTTFWIFI